MDSILAKSLDIYAGVWLFMNGKWMDPLWISQHIVQLFVVELNQAHPHGRLDCVSCPMTRLSGDEHKSRR